MNKRRTRIRHSEGEKDRQLMFSIISTGHAVEQRLEVRAAVTPLGLERQAAGAKAMARVQSELAKTLNGIDHGALQRAFSVIK
jgi:hypothetical protein